MNSPVRRFLALATISVALILGAGGVMAPTALAAQSPTHHHHGGHHGGLAIDGTTIPQLEWLMDHHRLTSVQLVQFYLHRIQKLNPKLHAIITVSPTALADARAADNARRHGWHFGHGSRLPNGWHFGDGSRLPLLGIPIIVKDNIDTTGMPTTAGSWALAGSSPTDAFIIQRLRAAGALIIGKANLSEWANWRSNPSSSGWSGIGGQTNMPYVLDRNPCGSSSGSGVAAAADLAVAAVGTETDGSVVCPSGANADVGIKPTLGLLSRAGIVPITADQDTAGPIARNVTDAAVLLGAMTGVDSHDPATAAQAGHAFTDYTHFLDRHALHGARIGVWRAGTYDPTAVPEVTPILDDTVAALQAAGATIVDPADIDISDDAYNAEFAALLCESKADIATYLQTYTGPGYPKTLQALLDFNNAHPELESGAPESDWNSVLWELAIATNGRDADCADQRAAATPPVQAAIDQVMHDNHLDAIIALTNGPAWVTDPVNGDDFSKFVGSSSAAAISGYADITVPAGFVGHLPVGVTFIGKRWSEPRLISLAYSFEQATHVRVPPTFLPTETSSAVTSSTQRGASTRPDRGALPGRHGQWRMPGIR